MARKHLRRYALVVALMAALGSFTVLTLWPARPVAAVFFAGVYTASYFALVTYSLMLDGSHQRMMGAEAERWTSQALRKARGWWVLDAVEFADFDVDHVAVSAECILAVETKWTSRTVSIDSGGVHGLWGDGLGNARRGAKRIRNCSSRPGNTERSSR